MAMAIGLVGGVVGAVGSIFQGQAQSAMYTYQAQVAQMNASIATQNAAFENALGETQQVQEGMKIRAQISQTRAAQGASGLDVNSGSNASVRESELEIGKIDQSNIRFNAARRAYGDQIQAVQDTAQAQVDLMGASTAKTAGTIGAFSSILGSVGRFAGQQQQAQTVGLGGVAGMLSGAPLLGLGG